MKLFLILFIVQILTIPISAASFTAEKGPMKRVDSVYVDKLLKYANQQSFENTDTVFRYASECLDISKKINYEKGLLESYFLLGKTYNNQGLYDLALDHLLKAKALCMKRRNTYLLSSVLLNIGNVYLNSDRFQEARLIYSEALNYSLKSGNKSVESRVYRYIGLVYSKLDKKDSALMYLKKAYRFHQEKNDNKGEATTLYNIGDYYLQNGKYDSAIYFLNHSLEKYEELKPTGKAKVYNRLALVYSLKGNIHKSMQYADTAYRKTVETKSLSSFYDYYQVRYHIDSLRGDYRAALNSLNRIYRLREQILNQNYSDKLSAYQTYYQLQKKENEIHGLKAANVKIQVKADQNKLYFILSTILALLSISVVFLIFRLFRIRTKKNMELHQKNIELKEQKDELLSLNEEITLQKETLATKNTELRSVLDQLKDTKVQLIHSEKMASVGLLASGIAHEINTPLYYISGSLKVLEESIAEFIEKYRNGSLDNADEIIKLMDEMISNSNVGVESVTKIIQSLMTFAFRGDSRRVPEKIDLLIDKTLLLIKHNIPSYIKIEKKYEDVPGITCYPDLLHQVFFNILTNAVQAIESKSIRENEKIIIETGAVDGQDIRIKIFNTGPRIPDSTMKSIFDPFFTTKEPGKGVGLGLAITYNIIREHEGSIQVSNLDKGVEFTITLPIK